MSFIRVTFHQMLKYSAVGIINTLIGLSVIFISMEVFQLSYIISNILGYACGLISSFILNKHWTFLSKGHHGKELLKFLLVFIIAYGIQFIALILLKEELGIMAEIAQLIGIGVYTIIGFILNKFITFRQIKDEAH